MRRTPPVQLAVVASLGILWGLIVLSVQILVPSSLGALIDVSRELGYFGPMMVISAISIPVLWILSGVGLVSGQKWGWWVAGAHYMSGVIRFLQAYLKSVGYHPFSIRYWEPSSLVFRNVVAVGLYCALLAFLYSAKVREWCKVETIPQRRALVTTGVIVVTLMGSATLVSYLLLKNAG